MEHQLCSMHFVLCWGPSQITTFRISSLDITGVQQPTSLTQIPNNSCTSTYSQFCNCHPNRSQSVKATTQEVNKTLSCLLTQTNPASVTNHGGNAGRVASNALTTVQICQLLDVCWYLGKLLYFIKKRGASSTLPNSCQDQQ